MEYVQLLWITTSTVLKILIGAGVGMFASRYFSNRKASEKGLSYIIARIFFPALLFSSLCPRTTWDAISKYWTAPVLSLIPMALGFVTTQTVFRLIFHKHYRGLVFLGCVFQNGTTFPLSILANIKGISWFDSEASVQAMSYVFLYNILCIISLWGFGEPYIAACGEELAADRKRRRAEREAVALKGVDGSSDDGGLAENASFHYPFPAPSRVVRLNPSAAADGGDQQQQQQQERSNSSTVSTDGTASANAAVLAQQKTEGAGSPQKRSATVAEQRSWYRPPQADDAPLRLKKPSTAAASASGPTPDDAAAADPNEEKRQKKRELGGLDWEGMGIFSLNDDDIGIDSNRTEEDTKSQRAWRCFVRAMTTPNVTWSIAAIIISLVPPLRWVAERFFGQIVIGGFTIVGAGAIPMQLLLLGSTVVSSKPDVGGDADDEGAAAEAIPDDPPQEALLLDKYFSQQTLFTVCSIVLRLVVVPGVSFLCIHVFRKLHLIPEEKPFILAMLVATCAPAAINGSIICAMHDYHGKEYSKMIFAMCTSAIPASAIWLFFYIIYLGGY